MDVFVEFVERGGLAGIELAGHAAVEDRQRLRADVFGQLEVFIKAEAEGLEVVGRRPGIEFVVPAIDDGLAFGNVADRGLPAIARGQQAALDDAAAGKAQKAGMHVVEQLDQVLAQPVGTVLPGIDGEEGDHVQIEGAGFVDEEIQLGVLLGGSGADDGLVVLPGRRRSLPACRCRSSWPLASVSTARMDLGPDPRT